MRRTITLRPDTEKAVRAYRVYLMLKDEDINITDAINNLVALGYKVFRRTSDIDKKTD